MGDKGFPNVSPLASPAVPPTNGRGGSPLPPAATTDAPKPMVGAAVPCRPPRPQPTVGAAVPCGPPCPQPHGRGGSPLPPAPPPDREAVSLKTCSPLFLSGTCGASRRSVSVAFCCSSEFLLHVLLISTAIPVRAAGTAAPTVGGGSRSPPSLYIFYILYTVTPLPPPHSLRSLRLCVRYSTSHAEMSK